MTTQSTRRQFLTATSLAASWAAAQPFLGAAETTPKPGRLKKGIMYDTIGLKGTVMEKFQAARTAHFDGVEAMSHMNQEEVLRARDETGLEVPSVCCRTHWDKPLTSPDAKIRAEGVAGMQQALRDAHRYGATSVLCVPGVVNENISYAEAYTRSQAEIRKLIPLAAELKVKIAIENVWNHFLLSPLEAARYVDEFKSPWVGWHFDVGNVVTFGWPEQWIRILGRRIQKLHIKEFSRKRRDNEGLWKGFDVEFLRGDNRWPVVMQALDDIGYHGWGIAEQGGADSLEGMTRLSSEMDQIFALRAGA